MSQPSRYRLILLAAFSALLAVIVAAYWPYFRTFIGTDLGVYWEVSRRLHEDGQLALGINYWDHKPPAAYFALLPWHRFTTPELEFRGLKLGALAIYLGSFALVALALLRAAADRSPARTLAICGIVATAAAFSLDARLDAAQNGLPSIGALCFEAAGLAFLAAAVMNRKRVFSALLAGFLLASAPFWRPTSAIGGFLLACAFGMVPLVALMKGRPPKWTRAVFLATVSAGITLAAWLYAIVALGTPLPRFAATVVEFNVRYGAHFRGLTPIGEFFRQDDLAYGLFRLSALVLIALLWMGSTSRTANDHKHNRWPVAIAGVYALFAVLAAMQARKIQSFYVFQFSLPMLFAAAFAIATSSTRTLPTLRWIAGGSWVACMYILSQSLSLIWPVIRENTPNTNRAMQTGAIVKKLANLSHGAPRPPRLWVCGNRAPLYQAAALAGIDHYDWTVYDTALFAADDVTFDTWIARFAADPPEFIVRLGNAQSTPWEPAAKVAPRAAEVNKLIDARYEVVDVPQGGQSTWPYGYAFTAYRLKVH